MDRNAIEDLYAYTDFLWDRLARTMDQVSDEQFAAPIPGSGWPSLHRAFVHVVGAYDGWLNDDWGLNLGQSPTADLSSWTEVAERMSTWEAMRVYRGVSRKTFRAALDVPDSELYAKQTRELSKDFGPEELSRADILANLLVHEIGHRGDISTLFHQLGIKGLLFDYRFFVSKPNEFIPDTPD
jgi:uncharacterized damage-inducible protein DinB